MADSQFTPSTFLQQSNGYRSGRQRALIETITELQFHVLALEGGLRFGCPKARWDHLSADQFNLV
jgi:hypothetical protein